MNPAAPLPPARPGQPACRFCGTPLLPHQAARGAVCGAPHCETRRVQEAARHVFHRGWHDYVDRQRAAVHSGTRAIGKAVRDLGREPEAIAYGAVPRLERPLEPLPAARRSRFLAHLESVIGEAFEGKGELPEAARREAEERAEHPLINATCATCGGACCMLGGARHAFLDADTIQLFRHRNPGVTPEEVRAHYLGRLPAQSIQTSCVYHGERGCVLERGERADICNRYHCNPQARLLDRFREMGADAAVIVAEEDNTGCVVATYDETGGWRPVAADAGEEADPDLTGRAVAAAIAQVPPHLPVEGSSVGDPPPACAWCGIPIDRHLAVTTRCCGRPACESRRTADIAARIARREEEQHRELIALMRESCAAGLDMAAAALGVGRDALVVGVVPHDDAPAVPLPPSRRAAFAAHLAAIAEEGFAIERPEDQWSAGDEAPRAAPEPDLAGAACATCRGSCCRLGADNMAFLTARDVCRYRQTEPAPTPEGFVRRYLDLLPDVSAAGSCVFHGAAGCTVPRAERSSYCNTYRCTPLKALLFDREAGQGAAAAIVAESEGSQRALGICGRGGWRILEQASDRDTDAAANASTGGA